MYGTKVSEESLVGGEHRKGPPYIVLKKMAGNTKFSPNNPIPNGNQKLCPSLLIKAVADNRPHNKTRVTANILLVFFKVSSPL
jgi:hypothetical protein